MVMQIYLRSTRNICFCSGPLIDVSFHALFRRLRMAWQKSRIMPSRDYAQHAFTFCFRFPIHRAEQKNGKPLLGACNTDGDQGRIGWTARSVSFLCEQRRGSVRPAIGRNQHFILVALNCARARGAVRPNDSHTAGAGRTRRSGMVPRDPHRPSAPQVRRDRYRLVGLFRSLPIPSVKRMQALNGLHAF
jgi:hypothetical protein